MSRIVIALLCFNGWALAQVPKQPAIAKPPTDAAKPEDVPETKHVPAKPSGPPEFEIRFADESSVRAILLDASVVVATKYGKLTIPVSEIRRIEMGFRYPDGVEAKVNAAISDLGAAEFPKREAAEKTLMELKEFALPAVKRATKSTDKEVSKRADGLLKLIKEKIPEDRQDAKEADTIETGEFTFQGKVETVALKAKTKYFAETPLKIAELRGLRMAGFENNESITVEAAKYGLPNNNVWMETSVEITAGRPFETTASGQVDQLPQQGNAGQYLTQPNGQPQYGNVQVMSPNGRAYQFSSGTLLGRIGPNGEPFVLGNSYKSARMAQSGKLYLKIAGSQWGCPTTGSYKVTVKSGG